MPISFNFQILYENLFFLVFSTLFFLITGQAWRHTKSYDLPRPLPDWFKIWFAVLQIGSVLLPVLCLAWAVMNGQAVVTTIWLSYLLLLGLQILVESATARYFHSTIFVMVPYIYIPYRIWQLCEGLALVQPTGALVWVRYLLMFEIVLWILNYCLDLSQLPRLFHWLSLPTQPKRTENRVPSRVY